MRVLVKLICAVGIALLLASCRVDATIDIVVDADGSGDVRVNTVFDAAAVDSLDGLGEQLFLSDLAAAGWVVDRSAPSSLDQSVTIALSKPFVGPRALQAALDDLAGPGVFSSTVIDASDGFATRSQRLAVDLDLSRGWELFSDAEVAEELGGEPFGVPVESLTDGRSIDEIITLIVRASVAADPDQTPSSATWAPQFSDAAPTTVRLEATVESSMAVTLRWIGWALASLFVLAVGLAGLGMWFDRKSGDTAGLRGTGSKGIGAGGGRTRRESGVAGTPAVHTVAPAPTRVQLVIIEPRGLLFESHGDLAREITGMLESRLAADAANPQPDEGSARIEPTPPPTPDELAPLIDDVIHGRCSTSEFWADAGVDGDPDELDELLVSRRTLRSAAGSLLTQIDRRGLRLAVMSDDAATWSHKTRDTHRLQAIDLWLVSSDVGASRPDPGQFEVLRRASGIAHGQCLCVDTSIAVLDVARALGMRTVLVKTPGAELPAIVGHPVVDDITKLVRRLQ